MACFIFIAVYSIKKDDDKMRDINNIVTTVLSSNKETMLYVGEKNCEACNLEAPQMSLLLEKYNFQYYYVDFAEITTKSAKNKFIKDLKVDLTKDFQTPTILIYKNGKILDQMSGLTSVNKIFNSLQEYNIIPKENALPVSYLNLSTFIKLRDSNEKAAVMLGSAASIDSNNAQGIIWNIAQEKKVTINYFMLNDVTEDEGSTFEKSLDFYSDQNNQVTTPTMLIIENGQVINSLVGLQDSDTYINFLKENRIID
jgi:predicted bacteriocin transport accessory protein